MCDPGLPVSNHGWWRLGMDRSPPPPSLTKFLAGGGHCCGLDTEGRAVCWGGSDRYRGGKQQESIGPFKQITAGEDHACALEGSGRARCWGRMSGGVSDPPKDAKYSLLAAGGSHTVSFFLHGWSRS